MIPVAVRLCWFVVVMEGVIYGAWVVVSLRPLFVRQLLTRRLLNGRRKHVKALSQKLSLTKLLQEESMARKSFEERMMVSSSNFFWQYFSGKATFSSSPRVTREPNIHKRFIEEYEGKYCCTRMD